jgi:putative inorganic carbon (HCO3(-)) transporter
MNAIGDQRLAPAPALDETRPAAPLNWPFLAFVLLMPLQNLVEQFFPRLPAGLNFLNLMLLASLVGAWCCGAGSVRGTGLNGWVLAYAALALVSLVQGMLHVSDGDAHPNILKDQLVAVAFLFLAQASAADARAWRSLLLAALLPLPYLARVVYDQYAAVSSWHYSHDLRVSGTFTGLGANEMGAFCVTALLVALGLLAAVRTGWRWRALLALAATAAGIGVVLSYSRAAYVSALLGLALLAVLLLRSGGRRWTLALLLAGAALLPQLPPSVMERFESIELAEGQRDESTEHRFEFWQLARASFSANPVFGTGFHTFHHAQINPRRTDTHNFFLRELAEKGLAGVAVLLGMLWSIARVLVHAVRKAAPGGWTHGLALGLSGAFLALLCGNFFGDRFTHYAMIAHFWLFLGLLLRGLALEAEAEYGHGRA